MHRLAIASVLVLAACGGDDGGATPIDAPRADAAVDGAGTCAPAGNGTFVGSVDGTAISPVLSAGIVTGALWEIGIFENATCAPTGSGQFLDLQFCAEPAVGAHPVILSRDQQCPTGDVAVLYLDDDRGSLADATGGTVTIDALGPCTSGSYDLTFPGGHVTGTFSAVSAVTCP